MVAVTYQAPTTVNDAVQLLAGAEGSASVLSGGTDLIIQMQSMVGESRLVVDSKNIPGMKDAELTDEGLSLGPVSNTHLPLPTILLV